MPERPRARGSSRDLRLVLLGPPGATRSDHAPLVFSRRKSLALLARLAVAPGVAIPRATLTTLLWGGVAAEQAADSLRHALTDIRRALGRQAADVLQTKGDAVLLVPGSLDVDVVAFERLANDPARLDAAAREYAGDFLAGFEIREPAFDAWRAGERQRLRAVAIRTLSTLLARHTAADQWPQAIAAAVRLLEIEPLDEGTHRALMRLS